MANSPYSVILSVTGVTRVAFANQNIGAGGWWLRITAGADPNGTAWNGSLVLKQDRNAPGTVPTPPLSGQLTAISYFDNTGALVAAGTAITATTAGVTVQDVSCDLYIDLTLTTAATTVTVTVMPAADLAGETIQGFLPADSPAFSGVLSEIAPQTTPSAYTATQFAAFASVVSGATLMGYGTTNDVTLKNRAGTTVVGVTANTTGVTMAGALAITGALSGITTLVMSSTLTGVTAITYSTLLSSVTALATPTALAATALNAFASTISGASFMGFGTTNDLTLMNRAGTPIIGLTANTTGVTMAGALAITGALSGVTTFALSGATTGGTTAVYSSTVTAGTLGAVALQLNGAMGAAQSGAIFTKLTTAIADNTATTVLTITMPNVAGGATVQVTLLGMAGAGGAIGAYEDVTSVMYNISIARTVGVAVGATISAAYGSAAAVVVGAGTMTAVLALVLNGEGVGATNTVSVKATIDQSSTSTNHRAFIAATILNDTSGGVTLS